MVKVTLEEIRCDVCKRPGERYTVSYPDGLKVLDRCDRHNKKILGLRDEAGDWSPLKSRRNNLRVMTPAEIQGLREG